MSSAVVASMLAGGAGALGPLPAASDVGALRAAGMVRQMKEEI